MNKHQKYSFLVKFWFGFKHDTINIEWGIDSQLQWNLAVPILEEHNEAFQIMRQPLKEVKHPKLENNPKLRNNHENIKLLQKKEHKSWKK